MLASFLRFWRCSVQKHCKSDVFDYPIEAPLQGTLANICINFILPENRGIGRHLSRWQYGSSFIQIFVMGSENACIYVFWNRVRNDSSRSSKLVDFGSYWSSIVSNLSPATPPQFRPNIEGVPLGLGCRCWGSEERRPRNPKLINL